MRHFLLSLFFLFVFISSSFACGCNELVFEGDIRFSGIVKKIKLLKDGMKVVHFEILEISYSKGSRKRKRKRIKIYTAIHEAGCGLQFSVGYEYGIIALKNHHTSALSFYEVSQNKYITHFCTSSSRD